MSGEDKLNDVLKKYRFTEPVPPRVRRAMEKSKRKTLAAILRGRPGYGAVALLSVSLFALLRKAGISASISKCAVAAWCAVALTVAAAASGGAYVAVCYVKSRPPSAALETSVPEREESPAGKSAAHDRDRIGPHGSPGDFAYGIRIVRFESATDASLAGGITQTMRRILAERALEKRGGVSSPAVSIPRPRLMLTGSLVRHGNAYRVTARLTDTGSSRIIMMTDVSLRGEEDVETAGREIADRIADAIY